MIFRLNYKHNTKKKGDIKMKSFKLRFGLAVEAEKIISEYCDRNKNRYAFPVMVYTDGIKSTYQLHEIPDKEVIDFFKTYTIKWLNLDDVNISIQESHKKFWQIDSIIVN